MDAQGWYADPFEQHEARWFSAGAPTGLVRDGETEASEPPPRDTWTGPLVRIAEKVPAAGADLQRSDDWDRRTTGHGVADGFAAADVFLG